MRAAARHTVADDTRVAALEANVERLTAIVFVLSGRVAQIEGRTESADDVTSLKGAKWITGYSLSQLRKDIDSERIEARKVGGHWVIKTASLANRMRVRK